jgi:arabinogalactan endo-1,4-beta-galactosidase
MKYTLLVLSALLGLLPALCSCQGSGAVTPTPASLPTLPGSTTQPAPFYFGADVSFVNQIIDHGGVYTDQNEPRSPYQILHDHGANVARFRLWHNPVWTKEIYGPAGKQVYNDIADVEKGIRLAKAQGMLINLDIHYSDTWADPARQDVPQAWAGIKTIGVLTDSVYQYTYNTLQRLNRQGLLPDMVQIGNEINCGMLYSKVPTDFPTCNTCTGQWAALGQVLNAGIRAVRAVSVKATVMPKVLLHVADPKNVDWWFGNIITAGQVTDFDVIGFSYYPLWHTTVPVDKLAASVTAVKSKYGKPVMVLETGYPWTTASNDQYNNLFGALPPLPGFPFTQQGQLDLLNTMTRQIKDGGGDGIMYWEPAWITSANKDLYGTGSAWENTTLFDFSGKPTLGMEYMK